MNLRQSLATLGLISGLVMSQGCSSKLGPVNNITDSPVYQNAGIPTEQKVHDAIVQGLNYKGWGIIDQSRGWILARVDVSGHWAKVRITYDTRSYTILHFASSPGLYYDGGLIHRRYNNWITLLDRAIQKHLNEPSESDQASPAPELANEPPLAEVSDEVDGVLAPDPPPSETDAPAPGTLTPLEAPPAPVSPAATPPNTAAPPPAAPPAA